MIPSFPLFCRFIFRCVLAVSFFAAIAVRTNAADFEADFESANLLYEKGRYEEAAAAYEQLLLAVQTAPLHFNGGNAWFKAGHKGRAVAHWLQAEALDPRNERIQINLAFVRDALTGGTYVRAPWPAPLRRLTLNEWALVAAVPAWLLFSLLGLGALKPALRNILRVPAVLTTLVVITATTLLALTARDRAASVVAVVAVDEAVVRFGPLLESQSAFVAKDGTELRVTDSKDEWVRVMDPAGREGWLLAEQVIQLRNGRPVSSSAPPGDEPPLHASAR